jgi:hypothetical protein
MMILEVFQCYFNDLLKLLLNKKYEHKKGRRIQGRLKVIPGDDIMSIEEHKMLLKNVTLG